MLLRSLWLRPTVARPVRTLVTVLGVAIGVAILVPQSRPQSRGQSEPPAEITLVGSLRDFRGDHPDFDVTLFNEEGQVFGGWFCNNPDSGQGDAMNYPSEQVPVAQLTVGSGFSVSGTLSVFINDGLLELPAAFECAGSCPADLNNDGQVDAADLAILLGAWGPNPGSPADINGDGNVDAADLAVLLGSWGPC